MHISTLLIDTGSNPDRPRPGRLWLRNIYRVHQRLCMAFPSSARKLDDPSFLKPYRPDDFSEGGNQVATIDGSSVTSTIVQVNARRTDTNGFLFRIDPHPESGSAIILVQSAAPPDWDYAFQNAAVLLGAEPEVRKFEPQFKTGEKRRFNILANPVRKVSKNSLDCAGNPFDRKWIGKDVPVAVPDLPRWLERRAEPLWQGPKNLSQTQTPPGFEILRITDIQRGYVYVNKGQDDEKGRKIRSARYEGVLKITNADHFTKTLIKGIGPAKAFGFGLLTLSNLVDPSVNVS